MTQVRVVPGNATFTIVDEKDILGAALSLTPAQRERLAEEIGVSVAHDRGHDPAAIVPDQQLTAELDRRIASIDSGEAKTVTLADAEARALRRIDASSTK